MNLLIDKLIKNKKFEQYISDIKNKTNPVNISGLSNVGKSHIIAGMISQINKPICIVTYNEMQAKNIINDLKYFTENKKKIKYFPKKEITSYDYLYQSKELPYERIQVLNEIYNKKVNVIVTTIETLMQNIPRRELLYKNIIFFKVGQEYKTQDNVDNNFDNLKKKLIELGYERSDLVEGNGQFSVRGGIVDIGLSEKQGVRIEFWGDEIDSIRYFNISSQRTEEMADEITIYPAHEYIIENQDVDAICKKIEEKYLVEKSLNEEQKNNVKNDVELIKSGDYISKVDKYFNEFYERKSNLFEYLKQDYLICIDEIDKINQRRENVIIDNNNLIKVFVEKDKIIPEAIENISNNEFYGADWINIINKQIIYMQTNDAYTNINKYEFNYRQVNFYKSETNLLISEMKKWIKDKKEVVILVNNELDRKKTRELLLDNDINNVKIESNAYNMPNGGFECYDLNLVVVNLSETFDSEPKKRKSSGIFKESEKIVFADLKPGDYVVHRLYGIGQFMGVNTVTADNVTKDYAKIKYQNEDMLYVPTSSLDNVRKYVGGGENFNPKINKLGSKEWYHTKEKVKKNLREVAKDLIELYAKRQKMKGFAFSKDTAWQNQFEDSFPYQETDDQLRCIEEVKKDMEQEKPMDRLLCGDVGYGKTEVAIRAAFKAVMDQKQVAYLVPTTILANQQYEEFKNRMKDFAIEVEVLNRFKTKKQQEEIIKKLKLGEIDVVVGTHRLLSKDVEFKDLGLLIIDEEHRFGVKDKEKIKKLKNSIDVLTMTATPIPRTLHMSILGVRDMSVIYEPPHNRRPVQTYVLEYDSEVIREAITKELERSGQVFYLYNNVENIEKKAWEIEQLVPEAKTEFAHGKMTGKQLEKIMEQFVNKEINVLVCTTILESGIDIPNANTIIVENSDRLGLAQLYQIRGRVGRSDKQAYAYVTYKRDKLLSEVADKRLKAIKEFTEFGSGFKIAMRDLEIRGAGSLLGEIQHGHMEQVGYDTYCKLLDEVVKEMQGIEVQEEQDIQIDINISSYIPDSYIDNSSQKIEIYQNIALCKTEQDIQNTIDEVIDRYGVMPKELENLIEIARIKELCRKSNVIKISEKKETVVFFFKREKFNTDITEQLIKKYKYNIKFASAIDPYISLKINNKSDEKKIEEIKEFLNFIV